MDYESPGIKQECKGCEIIVINWLTYWSDSTEFIIILSLKWNMAFYGYLMDHIVLALVFCTMSNSYFFYTLLLSIFV